MKEREDYSLEMYGARDYLDSFPPNQRPIATILHSWLFYALVYSYYTSCFYTSLVIATHTLHFLKHPEINARMNQHAVRYT